MATKTNTKDLNDNTEEANDAPLAGSGNLADAIKKLLKKGKERGHVTLDELNAILPPERISSELIEDVMAQLNDMGINVVEGEESEEDPENSTEGKASEAEDYGRTDDPVRLYLREMGAVELLSREGEIAIAKRIEAGREMMISGICDSPLTIQAILDWNEALKAGRLLLRDIIDLEATQDSPETASESPGATAADRDSGDAITDAAVKTENRKSSDEENTGNAGEAGADGADSDDSSFEDEDNISLAAIEEKLKPQVIETFDAIAATYVKLNKLQHQRLLAIEKGEQPTKGNDTKIVGYKDQLVELVRTVRFNNARLEQLVQQLYTLNRRLMGLEGRLLRFGLDVGLSRDEFLERYYEHELDPNWFNHILQPPPPPKPQPKAEPKIVENASARMLAHAQRQREAAAKEAAKQKLIDDKAAAAKSKKDEIARAKAVIAEQKAAAKEAAAAVKAQEKAKEKDLALKALAAAKDAATKQKAKELAQKQREKSQLDAQRQRDAAAKAKLRDQAQRQREKEAAAKAKQRDQLQRQREKAQADAARQRDAAAKDKSKAKPKLTPKSPGSTNAKSTRPADKKVTAKPVAKKASAKQSPAKPAKAIKPPVKNPAAKKTTIKSPNKSSAKPSKPAAKAKAAKPPHKITRKR